MRLSATRKKPVAARQPTASRFRPHRTRQSHFRTLRLGTPFQPRIDALARTQDWYNWAGYRAPHSLWDEELEYFAIRSQAGAVRHLADDQVPDRGAGRRSLPRPRHAARCRQAQARPRPLHGVVRRRRLRPRRRHAVPALADALPAVFAGAASAVAARQRHWLRRHGRGGDRGRRRARPARADLLRRAARCRLRRRREAQDIRPRRFPA